ncbi:transglutaminase-like cysteine peptidase [Salinarimonas sp.]|uniref:transglutaminase-like cysteine peptidase n=1 Tax=Salinarimonas sp. TaxID=2766526 RepID=UPI00391A5B03
MTRNRIKGTALAVLTALGTLVATGAEAFPFRFQDPSRYLGSRAAFGEMAISPVAAHVFCREFPSECAVRRGRLARDETGAVRVTDRLLAQVQQVNSAVNASMTWRADIDRDGVPDRWKVRASSGDCEDFALEKRRRLLAAGWPTSALLLALGRDGWGTSHAVLIVRTDRGDFVLDNQVEEVLPLGAASFRLATIQSPERPNVFVRSGVAAAVVATSWD